MTALSATSVRTPKFGEVPLAKFTDWFMSPGPNVPKNSKGQPVVPLRNLPFGDENPHLNWERTTDAGGNKVYLAPWNDPSVKNDTINKMFYSVGGILTGIVMFLSAVVANSLGTRKAVSELSQHDLQLGQELGQQKTEQLVQSTSGYQYTEDIQAALASSRNANQTLGYIQQNVSSAMKQFSDDEIRGLVTRAGWDMTGDEINNMIAGLRASTTAPNVPAISTDAITSFVNSTLTESGTRVGNMTQLLLAIGDALPQPPPALANILIPLLSAQHPTQAIADSVEKDATIFFQNLRSEISTGSWKRLAVPVGKATTKATTVGQPVTVAKPSTALAEIPKAVPVGNIIPAGPTQKVHLHIPAQLALPAPIVSPNISAPSVQESDWGERSPTTGLRTTVHEVAFTTRDGVNHNGIVVQDGQGKLYGISKSEIPAGSVPPIETPTVRGVPAQAAPVVETTIPITPSTEKGAVVQPIVPKVGRFASPSKYGEPIDVVITKKVPSEQDILGIANESADASIIPARAGIVVTRIEDNNGIDVSLRWGKRDAVGSVVASYHIDKGLANQPSITNIAPLPAGQTGLTGQEVAPLNTAVEPSATQGTSNTIPTDNNTISRITAALDRVTAAKKSGGITKRIIDEFYQAMVAAKVPTNALHWKAYHKIENMPSLDKRKAMVADAVKKYNDKVLAEQMARGKASTVAKRITAEKFTALKEQTQEQIEKNGQELMAKAKKAMEGQKFGEDLALAQKKVQAERIIAALKERAKNLLKTQEWMRAEAERKAKDIAERARLIASIKGVSIKTAEERRAVQTATAGVKGTEKLFEKESSTQFPMLAERVGLHVNQRPAVPSEQEISLPDLRQLEAKVRALRDLGIEKRDAMKLARTEYLNKTADAITAQILTSVKPSSIPNVGEESHVRVRSNQLKEDIQWIADEKGRKVWQFQELDGFKDGTITTTLYDNAIKMENAVRSSVRTVQERITERIAKDGITGKTYNVERTLPNGQVVTQAQVLLVAINSLRQDNLYHLMAGNKYTEETIAQAIQSMTPEEVDVANMMIDDYGGSWPAVNAAYEYSHNGESLPELENYVHIELERGDTVGQPEGRGATELLHQDVIDRGWVQNSTTKDWEKSRVPRSAIPLREDPIATFISYIGQTTDFIHREGVSQDILQIVKDVHVKDAFTIRMGREGYRSVLQYAKDLGNPAGALGLQAVPPQWRQLERVIRNSRLAVSCSILALRASKMVTAGASYMTSMGQFGPETMLYGTVKLISNPNAAMRVIKEFMPVLYDRVLDPIRTEAEVTMSDLEKNWQRGVSKLRDWENVTFRIADTTDIASAAIGGLARATREHPERTIEENAFEVQRAILATHASELVEDKSDVYKQSEIARIFTAFTGEATAAADYLNYLGRGAAKGKVPAHRAFRQLLFTIVGVALVMRLADRISRGREKNPNAGKWYDTWWGYVALSAIENMIPILGRYITQGLQGMTWGSAPVALQPFEIIKNIFSSASKGNWKAVAGFIIELGGYVTAAPVKGYLEAKKWLFPAQTAPPSGPTSRPTPSTVRPHLIIPKRP
jgi:hypothetical protein